MKKSIPNHVALIPDGNRRWAVKRGFTIRIGHNAGAKKIEKLLAKWQELKIPYLTIWGSSFDNLTKRSKIETRFLLEIYKKQFKKLIKDKRVYQNKIKVNVFGRFEEILPKETQGLIKKIVDLTKGHNKFFLNFLLAYNGQDEIIASIQNIVHISRNKVLKVDFDLIKDNLWTKDLPEIDLIIRTGCENDPHNSAGFMMWHTAYSQLYYSNSLFPDFSLKEFEEIIIKDFQKRKRRRGV